MCPILPGAIDAPDADRQSRGRLAGGGQRMDGTEKAAAHPARLFVPPVFADPSARALSRVGVIDVGSNSVRLVVFDGAARSPAYFFNEKVMCGLGRGMAETGRLNPEGRERALAALTRFALLADGMALQSLTAIATAAVREAEDGPAFEAEVADRTGLRLEVINGVEEARLSAQGVLLGWPGAAGLVCDIGGSSVELAEIGEGGVGARVTTPLGPFRLQGVAGGQKGLRKHIRTILEAQRGEISGRHPALYLVGGSWRAIARLDMERRGYPLTVLHEYEMTPKSIRKTLDWVAKSDLKALRARTRLSPERITLVPVAGVVLREVLKVYRPKTIRVSAYGIREGVLYEQMPERLRARDPLIEACRFAEANSARLPGLGHRLFEFIAPLYRKASADRLRLVRAACLLHDVSWRAHPDYRAEACFDNATRSNLGGLDHRGRIFLGLALMHRYSTGKSVLARMAPLQGLLGEAGRAEAEILGKAMRFGAMLSGTGPEQAGRLKYYPKKQVLELVMNPRAEALFGEAAQARFAALATALGAGTLVRTARRDPPEP